MARRAFPSRRSGQAVYRAPSWLVFHQKRRRGARYARGVQAGVATISGVVSLAGAGVKHASGTASITATVALTGPGVKGGIGEVVITGTAELSGAGEKASGIGSVPRPRIRWQLIAGAGAGGHELALTEARSRRFTARLTDPAEVSFSLDARHPQATAVEELTTDIHVLWTSDAGSTTILSRCRVGAIGDSGDDVKHVMEVGALDYRAVLRRRNLLAADTLTYTAADQAEIAWGLVNTTQAHTGGDLGISKGWAGTTPTGVSRDRTYEPGDKVGERIQELSEVIDGFDWDIVPESASSLSLQVYFPQRGSDRGVVLEAGGLVRAWRREVAAADYGNALRYTGSTDPVTTPVEAEASDLAGRAEGRWDLTFGDEGLGTQQTLEDRALWQLAQSQVVTPIYTLTLVADAWEGPEHIWLGDPVRVVIMSGRLSVNAVYRVFEMSFGLGEDGEETLEVTTGGPRPDYRRKAALTERRLRDLERR